jgi:formiminoglutamase
MDVQINDDIRIGALWEQKKISWDECRVVLISLPCDEGVRRNGGRTGSAQAPDEILGFLRKLCPDPRHYDLHRSLIESVYCTTIDVTEDLEADQHLLAAEVAKALKTGKIPVILGGGHETSYGHFLGYVEAKMEVSILNWDAHPDVRPLKAGKGHSGSPFRQAAEHPSGMLKHYSVMGLQPQSVAVAHLEYLHLKGYQYVWAKDLSPDIIQDMIDKASIDTMMTIDLDVIDQSYAPGVSAPNAAGLDSEMVYQIAYLAGKNPNIRSFDIVELNPNYDRDHQTSRLAALSLWYLLLGIAQRS